MKKSKVDSAIFIVLIAGIFWSFGALVVRFIEANLMPGLRKGYFYRSCLLNFNMSYEQMILTVADNGLSSQRIHFSTNSIRGKNL